MPPVSRLEFPPASADRTVTSGQMAGTDSWLQTGPELFARPTGTAPLKAPGEALASNSGEVRRILVPLDGTRAAEQALPHALALSRRTGATVQIAQVYSYFEEFHARNISWFDENPDLTIRRPRENYLASLVRRITRIDELPLVATLVSHDSPDEVLLDMRRTADLTIMTSRHRSWWDRFVRRSMSDRLLANPGGPILLVGGHDGPVDLTADPAACHRMAVIETEDDLPRTRGELWLGAATGRCCLTILPLRLELVPTLRAWKAALHAGGESRAAFGDFDIRLETNPQTSLQGLLKYIDDRDVDQIVVPTLRDLRIRPWSPRQFITALAAHSPVPVLVRRSGPRPITVTPALDVVGMGPRFDRESSLPEGSITGSSQWAGDAAAFHHSSASTGPLR